MLLKYYSVVILCLSVVNGEPGEPKCFSRFDYDEKMLMKQLRFEDKVQKFEEFINGIKAREAKEQEGRDKLFAAELEKVKEFNNGAKAREALEKEERDKLFDAEILKVKNFQRLINEVKTREEKALEERSKLFLAELKKYKQENVEEVERQKNVTSDMLESVANSKMEFENVHKEINERMKEKIVAFTGTTPKAGASSNSMSFTTVITNEGNAFDTSTGKFTCPVSGLYYFTLHITKKRAYPAVDSAGCYIYLNGSSKMRAYIDPYIDADIGSYGVSTSVYLNLKVGDVVTIENCSGAVEPWTSFSGYLERQV